MKEYWERKPYLCLVRNHTEGSVKGRPAEYIKGGSEDNSNIGHDRGKERSKTPGTTEAYYSDTILDAMGPGDEDCMVTRIKRG